MKSYFTAEDEKLKWKVNSVKELFKTFIFSVTAKNSTAVNGVSGDYYVMNANDWVIVIPEKEENFLMVKQWRHGENALSIEFPGGVIDSGENPLQAAARELQEETGYKAGELIHLGTVNPNPALFANHVHVYLAKKLEATGVQELDNDEFINYLEIPKNEVFENVGTQEFPHALMGMAVAYYHAYEIKNKGQK